MVLAQITKVSIGPKLLQNFQENLEEDTVRVQTSAWLVS